ncbi:MAG: RNA polymerase subunit sigma [Pelagibacterium sp. SCN 63-23]|nr:MAG: RNA polymerase subunit sigma [Pelagibacterium sp. SCN 63-23]
MQTIVARAAESDEQLVDLARLGSESAIRTLIQRNNRRLFRAARAVLVNDAEAEDAVQEAYVKAFTRLDSFRGEARFSTWLTRIALNEALGRKRKARPMVGLEGLDEMVLSDDPPLAEAPLSLHPPAADQELMRMEIRSVLERALDDIPAGFRIVFVLRDIEGMSVDETASLLRLNPNTVKTRLHRAHLLLRKNIEQTLSASFADIFPFDGARCVHMADRVIARLRLSPD